MVYLDHIRGNNKYKIYNLCVCFWMWMSGYNLEQTGLKFIMQPMITFILNHTVFT